VRDKCAENRYDISKFHLDEILITINNLHEKLFWYYGHICVSVWMCRPTDVCVDPPSPVLSQGELTGSNSLKLIGYLIRKVEFCN
jgi:hypothetical protein